MPPISEWPSVGLHASSLTRHASNIRIDIEHLHRHIGGGNDALPSEVFLAFSFSVLELVEKVLDQPDLNNIFEMMRNIDARTKRTLDLVETRTKHHCENRSDRDIGGGGDEGSGNLTPHSDPKDSISEGSIRQNECDDGVSVQDGNYQRSEEDVQDQNTELNENGDEMQDWLGGFGVLGKDDDWKPSPSEWLPRPGDHTFKDIEDPYDVIQGSMDWMTSLQDTHTSARSDEHVLELTHDCSPSEMVDSPRNQAGSATSSVRPHRTRTTKIVLPTSEHRNPHGKIYAPLSKERKEIRVVHLTPTIDSEFDISCTFSVVSLHDKPVYRALSYTWGDAQDTLPIILNGHRFQATRNLKAALRRLRELDTTTPVWIDAICINQQDLEERTHQVQLMRDIYQSTTEVVVYLGEPLLFDTKTLAQQTQGNKTWDAELFKWTADDADMEKIEQIIQYSQAYADTYPDLPDERTTNPPLLMVCFIRLLAGDLHLKDMPLMQNVNLRRECLFALQGLVTQPWWSRIWCVQEVILPPAVLVVYGRFKAPLHMYADAAVNLQHHQSNCCKDFLPPADLVPGVPNYLQTFKQTMNSIMEGGQLWQDDPTTTLIRLLSIYYPRQATDARDKVYGLLGLVRHWGDAAPLVPDYSISDQRVFEDAAFNIMATTKSLDFLYFRAPKLVERIQMLQKVAELCEHPNSGPDSISWPFSSWATDWGRINEAGYETIVAESIARSQVFNACASLPAPYYSPLFTEERSPIGRATVLTVSAYRIGKIRDDFWDKKSYGKYLLTTPHVNINSNELALPLRPNKEVLKPYIAGGTLYDAMCRAICGDTFFTDEVGAGSKSTYRRATSDDVESVKLWRKWLRKLQDPGGTREIPQRKAFGSDEEYQRVLSADRAVRSAGIMRRYFDMEEGYIGLAEDAQGEDEIMVLLGAKTPFVLRSAGHMKIEGLGLKPVYVVIGECYLVGCMDGQVVRRMQGQRKEPEEVYLI